MARQSPNRKPLDELGAIFMPYAAEEHEPIDTPQVVQGLEEEYRALREACALMDMPTRGTLEITGADRLDFLNNMVTQELRHMAANQSRRSFWLNRKGRIDADLRLIETGERMWADVDAHRAGVAARSLGDFVFAEDVAIEDRTDAMHRMSLHGPEAKTVLVNAAEGEIPNEPGEARVVAIAGAEVVVDRQDSTGEVGLELLARTEDAAVVFGALRDAGEPHGLRVCGWHAWNIARLEAGWPVYYLDFGPDSIPQETGVFADRVSTTKGCYLGQEVVARLESLGKPKQKLVGLDLESDDPTLQPMTGDLLYAENAEKPVGAVTSATRSPALGDRAIAFAQVRFAQTEAGTALTLRTGDGEMRARVRDRLAAVAPASGSA